MTRVYTRTMLILIIIGISVAFLGIFLINYKKPLIITGGVISITSAMLNDDKHEKFLKNLFRRK